MGSAVALSAKLFDGPALRRVAIGDRNGGWTRGFRTASCARFAIYDASPQRTAPSAKTLVLPGS